jgi:EmrB/QacA subfamily drug resistance transporter
MSLHTHPAHPPAAAAPERAPWTVLALMLAAQFMVVLDVSVVNIALPSISRSLAMTASDYQWAISAYVLFSGGLLLFGGRLADLFDRRRVFLTGIGLFTVSSLASGLAGTAGALIAARAGQGTGAALLTPAAMSILMNTYQGKQRATALAMWGTVGSMGIAAGVLFGGALTTLFDWRAVFFINVPVGIVVLAQTLRKVPPAATNGSRGKVDIAGAAALISALVTLVLSVEATRTHGWTDLHTTVPATISTLLFVVFLGIERRVSAPLVPGHVWQIRSLMSASTIMAGITGAVVGAIFLTSLYLQQVLGASAIVAGLEFLPLAAVITASAAAAAHLLPHTGPRALIGAGLLLAAAGSVYLAQLGPDSSYLTGVLPAFAILGAGVGPMFVAISVAAMGDVRPEESGLASGLMMTGHEVGAAIGVAALTAVAGEVTTRAGLIAGYPDAFWCIAAAMVALLIPTALLPKKSAIAAQGGHGHGGHGHGGHGH